MPLRHSFEEVAELYDRVRPGYPEAVFDDLVELARLAPGSRGLELGPGTGRRRCPRGLLEPFAVERWIDVPEGQ